MKNKRTFNLFVLIILLFLFGWGWRKYHLFRIGESSSAKSVPSVAENKEETSAQAFKVKYSSFNDVIEGLVGTVKGDTIELAFTGNQEETILAIAVKVGQVVERGKILAELDHTRSASRKSQAQSAYDRAKSLLEVGGATAADVRDAKAALDIAIKDYEDTFIRAPKRGYISQIARQVGESVNRNEALIVLVGTEGQLYLETGVNETQIEKIVAGQKAEVKIDALMDAGIIEAQVEGTSHEVTVSGRSGTVQIALPNALQKRLRPGLSAQARIVCFAQEKALVIPSEAYDPQKKGVFQIVDSSAVFKPVELGYTRRDYFQVIDGLNDGALIVNSLVSYPVQEGQKIKLTGETIEYKP